MHYAVVRRRAKLTAQHRVIYAIPCNTMTNAIQCHAIRCNAIPCKAIEDNRMRAVERPVSFPVEKDPGGADGAPEGVEEEGPIRLPCQGQYKSGLMLS